MNQKTCKMLRSFARHQTKGMEKSVTDKYYRYLKKEFKARQ